MNPSLVILALMSFLNPRVVPAAKDRVPDDFDFFKDPLRMRGLETTAPVDACLRRIHDHARWKCGLDPTDFYVSACCPPEALACLNELSRDCNLSHDMETFNRGFIEMPREYCERKDRGEESGFRDQSHGSLGPDDGIGSLDRDQGPGKVPGSLGPNHGIGARDQIPGSQGPNQVPRARDIKCTRVRHHKLWDVTFKCLADHKVEQLRCPHVDGDLEHKCAFQAQTVQCYKDAMTVEKCDAGKTFGDRHLDQIAELDFLRYCKNANLTVPTTEGTQGPEVPVGPPNPNGPPEGQHGPEAQKASKPKKNKALMVAAVVSGLALLGLLVLVGFIVFLEARRVKIGSQHKTSSKDDHHLGPESNPHPPATETSSTLVTITKRV